MRQWRWIMLALLVFATVFVFRLKTETPEMPLTDSYRLDFIGYTNVAGKPHALFLINCAIWWDISWGVNAVTHRSGSEWRESDCPFVLEIDPVNNNTQMLATIMVETTNVPSRIVLELQERSKSWRGVIDGTYVSEMSALVRGFHKREHRGKRHLLTVETD